MSNYKTILSSVAFLALLSGCGDAQTTSTQKTEITESSIEKNDAVYASEDSLVNSMSTRALELNEGEFIEESIKELIPELVNSYVPDSYVEEVLSIEELKAESLLANRAFVEELQAFYESAHTDAKRASNVSVLYEIVASISAQVYDIIYNYLFGDNVSIGDVYDELSDSLFGENNESNSTSISSVTASSISSQATSSESSSEAASSESISSGNSSSSEPAVSSSSSSQSAVEEVIDSIVDGIGNIFNGDESSSSEASSESSSLSSSSEQSSSVSSSASSSSEAAQEEPATTALSTFISTTTIPDSFPTIFFNNYTMTSYDRVRGDIAEGDAVLAKVLIPAGATKVIMLSDGSSDFMNGLKYAAFEADVGAYCGFNTACSKEKLENVEIDSGYFSSGWEDTLYEGSALSEAQYRYVVFYNENGGTDDFSAMKTKITIGDKDLYKTWKSETNH